MIRWIKLDQKGLFIVLLFVSLGAGAKEKFGGIKCDSIALLPDTSQAILYKKSKTAVYDKSKETFIIPFEKQTLLPIENLNSIISFHENYFELQSLNDPNTEMTFYAKAKEKIEFYQLNDSTVVFLADDKSGVLIGELDEVLQEEQHVSPSHIPYPTKVLTITRSAGDYFIIENYMNDQPFGDVAPLKSQEYPEEDSIIFDEESEMFLATYPNPAPGYGYSGIYNKSTREWVTSPVYDRIFENQNGYLLHRNTSSAEGVKNNVYTLFHPEKGVLVDAARYDELIQEKDFIRLEKMFDLDEIMVSPEELNENEGSLPTQFRARRGNQMAYFSNIGGLSQMTPFADFIYYNSAFDYTVRLENDSIYIDFTGNVKKQVSQANGKIELITKTIDYDKQNVILVLLEGKDTVFDEVILYGEDTYFNDRKEVDLTVYLEGNRLIFNEVFYYTNLNGFVREMYEEGIYPEIAGMELIKEEGENSDIWEWDGKKWSRLTPGYAGIESSGFGYVVSTGYRWYLEEVDAALPEEDPKRYIILDNRLKAMSFYDYYDFDLIKVRPEITQVFVGDESFFLTSEGKVLTEIKWHDFRLDGNQLTVFRYQKDELGNVEFDEFFFEPIVLEKAVFDL